ncbi:hypothetical protein ACLRDC_20930, partial [Gluconacetobacter sacchari]
MNDKPAPFHSYTPREGHRLAHDPFNAIVGPRPVGWIGVTAHGAGFFGADQATTNVPSTRLRIA